MRFRDRVAGAKEIRVEAIAKMLLSTKRRDLGARKGEVVTTSSDSQMFSDLIFVRWFGCLIRLSLRILFLGQTTPLPMPLFRAKHQIHTPS